jgi:hypothetical protein
MTESIATNSQPDRIAHQRITLLFLLGLSCFIAVARFHTYDEPVEHDITATAVIANEMRAGRPYYSDVWENKPPALYIVHMIGQSLFGYGRGYLYALNVSLAVITLLGVYLAASSMGMGKTAGLWGVVFWTLISGDLDLQANQPNTEAFLNAPLIWAFALFLGLQASPKNKRQAYLRALAIGALLALASFFKPQSALYGLFFGIAHIAYPRERTPAGRKRAITEVLMVASVGLVAWIAFFAYFGMTGRFAIVYTTMFIYPSYYSGNMFRNLWASFGMSHLYPKTLQVISPLVFLTLVGGVTAWLKKMAQPWVMLIAYAIATQITIGIAGRYYIHYYQLWLPLFVVGAGWSIVLLSHIVKKEFEGWMPQAFAVIALLFMLQSELWVYSMEPDQWSKQEYGDVYAASEVLANEINKFLAPNETLYVFGDEPGFYFLTKRRPAVGAFFLQDVAGGPLATELTNRTINNLQNKPPDLVIILNSAIGDKTTGPAPAKLGPDHPLRKWVSEHYCPVVVNQNAFLSLCARPGSAVSRRPEYKTLVAELSLP